MKPVDRPSLDSTLQRVLPNPRTSAWRVALPALLLLVALIGALYWDTASAMVAIWNRSETFAHAFVVPPITLWLIWRRRHELALLTPKPAPWMLFPLASMVLLWLLGDLVAVNSVTQLAFTALLVLSVPALLGLRVARVIAFPLAFLFFAVPIGEFLMPQLMDWTADFTIIALRASGIPVYREGLQFVIPSGSWSVVEACSGVRYLIASLTVGTLFAYLNYQSTTRRVLFVIVSILVPVIANWLRAYMIVMLGHLSGNKLAVGVDHLIYGWVFFGVVILLMFVVGARWSEPEHLVGAAGPSALIPSGAPATTKLWITTACLVLLVSLPALGKWSVNGAVAAGVPQLVAPVSLGAGWRAADSDLIGFRPAFNNSSAEINRTYINSGKVVGLYLAFYQDQDYRRKLVSSDNVVVTSKDKDWSRISRSSRLATIGQQQQEVVTVELRRRVLAVPDQPERLQVWQIYWINGTLTSNDYLAKAYSAIYKLFGRGDDAAAIILYTEQTPAGGAQATIESFLSANFSAIDALLRGASGR